MLGFYSSALGIRRFQVVHYVLSFIESIASIEAMLKRGLGGGGPARVLSTPIRERLQEGVMLQVLRRKYFDHRT